MSTFMPLKDVTQHRLSTANKLSVKPSELTKVIASSTKHQQYEPRTQRYRHDPYNWNWRVSQQVHLPLVPQQQQQPQQALQPILPITMNVVVGPNEEPLMQQQFVVQQQQQQQQFVSAAVDAPQICRVLVQFKCHHNEFSSPIELKKGQYVVVQGDRGIDVGVVIRINTDEAQQYVERTGPTGSVVRHASQREVDYWASDLKQDETTALEYCRQRVVKHRLPMDVRHAEYQFDKKKLTFYYEAKARVDFVTLLKELFREFSCRIWMEKVRTHE